MKTHDGYIKFNTDKNCYGMIDCDGNWIKEEIEDGTRIDVIINGEWFATNFSKSYLSEPALKPHAWDNWDFLCGLPAIYHDSEKITKDKKMTEKEERRERYISALYLIVSPFIFSAILGALFALIGLDEDTTYLKNFMAMAKAMFFIFGAGAVAGGILLLLNIAPMTACVGFGCALYYGTILLNGFLSKFIYGAEINIYSISFVIVSLICYIEWIKNFKKSPSK